MILERPGATWFRLQDGAEVHVYGSDDEDHEFFGTAPVVGLAVDSSGQRTPPWPGLASSFSILSRNEPTAVLGSISARLA